MKTWRFSSLALPQVMGFGWMCVLFAACAAYYEQLTQPRLIDVFRLLYYASRYAPSCFKDDQQPSVHIRLMHRIHWHAPCHALTCCW